MLSQEEKDSDTDTGKSLKHTPEINVYVSPHEKSSDGSRLEEEKEATKNQYSKPTKTILRNIAK
jgi:hypothetical protein